MSNDSRLQFEVSLGRMNSQRRDDSDPPVVTILGDFSGSQTAPAGAAVLKRQALSFETLTDLFADLKPTVTLPNGSETLRPCRVTLASIDDFHPDRLLEIVPACRRVSDLLRALDKEAQQASAAAELRQLLDANDASASDAASAQTPQPVAETTAADAAAEDDAGMFERLLGRETGAQRAIDDLLKDTIATALEGHSSAAEDDALKQLRQQGLAMLTTLLRAVLTEPVFQQLERNWLGVDLLLRRVDDSLAGFDLIDLPWQTLEAELANELPLSESPSYRAVTEHPQLPRPKLMIALYSVGEHMAELSVLARLGACAAQCDAQLLAQGSLALCGCHSLTEAASPQDWRPAASEPAAFWQALRDHPAGGALRLATPRFALRQPYGSRTDAIERFDFEELPTAPAHEAFCWGNPALLCAIAMLNSDATVTDLPMALYKDAGGEAIMPCTEVLLSGTAAAQIANGGLMPLRARRDAGTVVL
ncbi:MAG: type VI secretion system contractile sheath large subunit [Pseudomonadota bacterium]